MQYKEDRIKTPWGVEVAIFTREGTNDWNTLYSCIAEDEYKIGELQVDHGKSTAVDIGAHAGGCSLAMLSRGFKVIAVEPLPENAELIMKNVKANGWENNFTLHHKAINEVSGKEVVLRYGNENTESGSHHRFIGNTIDSYINFLVHYIAQTILPALPHTCATAGKTVASLEKFPTTCATKISEMTL